MKTCGMQMHAPFLSCCEIWYGTNRICYDFVLRETWHLEVSFSKNAKIQKFLNDYEYLPRPYDMIYIQNLSHMLLVWALSFIKLLGTVLRFSLSTHDQDTRTPTNKLLTLTLRVTQKCLSVHQIITPFILSCIPLLKNFICQKG